jgi:hypothetical protein
MSTKPNDAKRKLRRKDDADETAERLFDMVRDAKPDQEVTDAIASALREESRAAFERGRVVGFAEGLR